MKIRGNLVRFRQIAKGENLCYTENRFNLEDPAVYLLLFVFFLILNGKVTSEILIFGLVLTVLFAVVLKLLFSYTPKTEWKVLRKSPYFLAFLAVLFIEVIKANLTVMRLIPKKEKSLQPVLVTFKTALRSDFCRFLFANSITLTPGTITVEAEEDVFTVHCLRRELLDTSENGRILKLLRKMEA